MRRRALVGLALLALGAPVLAQSGGDLERVRAAIEESRERVAAYEREERGLLDALEAIERSAALLREEAERARRRAREARGALARAESAAAEAERQLAGIERRMAKRAVALYRAGELGALRLVFAAGDLRDFFRRVQTLRRLLRHDGDLVDRHREQLRALESARADAALAATRAQRADAELARRSRELAEERARKRQLAGRMRRSRTLERRGLAELEVAAQALEETVAAWGRDEALAKPVRSEGAAFATLRGTLPAPVDGELRDGFGRVVDEASRTATFRKGLTWEAPLGAPVRAVAAGRVRFAGHFRGYGNVVILDHGDDYFSVSAHLDRVDVALGDPVEAGEVVGRVGETGSLSGPQLYFELRRGAQALDPTAWLAPLGTPARGR